MPEELPILATLDEQLSALDVAVEGAARSFLRRVFLDPAGSAETPFIGAVHGGKRFRALAALVGAAVARSMEQDSEAYGEEIADMLDLDAVKAVATALELYQASALVHDDLLDDSDTRRGSATTHVIFAEEHRAKAFWGDSRDFGRDGAVLVGNLLRSASENVLAAGLSSLTGVEAARLVDRFSQMTGEVDLGQWADTRVSYLPLDPRPSAAKASVQAALAVVARKSARYSIVHPAVLGALAAGGREGVVEVLESVLEPAGIAFQLRDDALGVFGDPQEIGKPNASDIVEGKRTVLLALAISNSPQEVGKRLASLYAESDLSAAEVAEIRDLLWQWGNKEHEELIAGYTSQALATLETAAIPDSSKSLLSELIERMTVRDR